MAMAGIWQQWRFRADRNVIEALLKLAIPIVVGNMLQSAYQLIDAFWVGRLGQDAIAAVAVSFPVTFLIIALGSGFAAAGSTLVAQFYGARNRQMVNHVAAQTILLVVVVSVLLGAFGFCISPLILTMMGVAPAVREGALAFLRVSFVGMPFIFGFMMFQALMRGVGEVRWPNYIVLGTVALNFVLDPLFIFGFGGFAGLGVMGAALATLCTQTMAAIAAMVILLRGRAEIQVKLANLRPDFGYIRKAFELGLPASIELSARGLSLMIMSFLIASFGTLTVAAYGVGTSILQVVMIPAMGLSMAIAALVGQNMGAGKPEQAERIARLGALLGFVGLSLVGGLAFVLAPLLAAFFVPNEPQVIAEASGFIRTMSFAWGFMGLQLCMTGVFRASGNMLVAMMLTLVSQWVIQFPLAYVLSKHSGLGAAGLWWAFPVTNIIASLISLSWYARGDWKKTRLTESVQTTLKVEAETLAEVTLPR